MNVIFLIGAVQALVFFFLMFSKKNVFTIRVLKILFAILSVHLCLIYVLTPEFLNLLPHFAATNVGFPLLYGPFLLFYVNGLIHNKTKFYSIDLIHFIPFILSYIILIPIFSLSAEEKLQIINGTSDKQYDGIFVLILQLISGPVYIVWVLHLLKNHRKRISDQYSFKEEVELKWLKHLTIGLLIVWIIVILSTLTFLIFDVKSTIDHTYYIYSAVTIFIFFIGFKGLQKGFIFSQSELLAEEIKTETKSKSLKKLEVDKIIDVLETHMKNEKPYLEERLTINDLAIQIKVPYYKLTLVFNEYLNQSFFNYINSLRVDEFKQKVSDSRNDSFTLLGIAYECGFASKSSFNRIFKQLTGQTPTEFKKGLSKS